MKHNKDKDKNNDEQSVAPRVIRSTKSKSPFKSNKKMNPKVKKGIVLASKIAVSAILIFTVTMCIVGTALTVYVMKFIDSDSVIDLTALELNYTAIVYAKDPAGNDVEVERLKSAENRVWVDYADVPQYMKDAIVAGEDERFRQHDGVDFKRTFAAFLNEFNFINLGSRQGGSTISQQLVKNINGDFTKRTIDVKIQEIFQAMNLERHYSKDQILEAYLNFISLHYSISGVGAGAKYYFDKTPSELTLNECVSLAVITKNPTKYNPITGPEENKKRRKYYLDNMLKLKMISQEEHDTALNEELVLAQKNVVDDEKKPKNVQSYFTDNLIDEITQDLMSEYGYSKEHAEKKLYTSGWSIYTTMDTRVQSVLEDKFKQDKIFSSKPIYAKDPETGKYLEDQPLQASMVIMDYEGNIKAMVGGRGEKTVNRGFNRVTMANRPAGSTMKPLGIYAPAFDKNIINWSMIMSDTPSKEIKDPKTGALKQWPNNYDKNFQGNMTIIDAIKVSKNTIPVRICSMLTPQTSFNFLTKDLGISTLVATGSNNNVNEGSVALGMGGTYLHELTAGYEMFGNGGNYYEPRSYTRVVDSSNKVILDVSSRPGKRVISPDTAYVMNKALQYVITDGSGKAANMPNQQVFGKTGTSDENKDLVFVAGTPYYLAGIRYGFDNNAEMINPGNSQMAVWKNIMTEVHKGYESKTFTLDPSGAVEMQYCQTSGGIATEACPDKRTGYYKKDAIPSVCSQH
ncbi:MAG: transglycosylase domain-containing protein [Oscillospiraceae bacterium]